MSVSPSWLRGALPFVIPLAFPVAVPAEAVSDRIDWWWLAEAVGVTLVSLAGARAVWKWGIENYSGASA